jgi:predicted unusual protein kinase regulating ubiquinone biosynthesis (AarF/ABC1/UbiB family)
VKVAFRTVEIATSIGSWLTLVAADVASDSVEKNASVRAAQLREKLTKLGPAFVKVGQALSTRPDLLPSRYLEELSSLQDALPTFSDKEAFALVEKELGRKMKDTFKMITPHPIAAASLGQVYKATALDTNEIVALKVQRPSIYEGLELDFHLIRMFGAVVDANVKSLNTSIVSLVDEFAERVFLELNYVQEGVNAERFARLYGDNSDVVVPTIDWERTSARVLTMEFIEGTKLSEREKLKEKGLDVLSLVDIGIQCSLRQLLEFGYFHADPHPGNLLATKEGKLAFLDFGMMSETPETARYAIIDHVVHLVNRDYEAMATDYYKLEFLDESVDVKPIVPALANFFDDVLEASVEELNFKTITDGLGGVLYAYPFSVPGYYALILRSLTVLEGLALSTDPKFKVLAKAYPYIARRLLTDPRPELRESFKELMFKDDVFRWNRLENLLREGSKNSDFNAEDVLPPLLDLAFENESGENTLRPLIEKETIKVIEALMLTSANDIAKDPNLIPLVDALPAQIKRLPPITISGSVAQKKDLERTRDSVSRCFQLYAKASSSSSSSSSSSDEQSSSSAEPDIEKTQKQLTVLTDALRQPSAQDFVRAVIGGVAERIAARFINAFLKMSSETAPDAAADANAGPR